MTSFATQSNIDMGGPGLLGSDVSGASRRKSKLLTIGVGLTLSAGVLSNSLDLSGYLTSSVATATYVPYTGATRAVNLGSYGLTVGAIAATAFSLPATGNMVVGASGNERNIEFYNAAGNPSLGKYSNAGISIYGSNGSLGSLSCNNLIAGTTGYVYWNGRGALTSSANGVVHVQNYDFNESVNQTLAFGAATTSTNGARIKRTVGASLLAFRNGDDSADAALTCGAITASSAATISGLLTLPSGFRSNDRSLFDGVLSIGGSLTASLIHPSAMRATWTNTSLWSGTIDAAIGRDSAGVIGLYTSDSGSTKAALTCGAITASGYITSNSTTPGFELKSSGTRVGFIYYASAENRLYSDTNAPWVVESNAGFKIRNVANTADAALTCGAITASGNIVFAASPSSSGEIQRNGASNNQGIILRETSTGAAITVTPNRVDVYGTTGFRVYNTIGTADGPITCGAITASGAVTINSGTTSDIWLAANASIGRNNNDVIVLRSSTDNSFTVDHYVPRISVPSNYYIAWSSASGNATAATDTALSRNAAGVVEVNNGTAGTYRDLLVRAITASGNLTLSDVNLITGTTTGTIFATTSSQKQAWWGATPIVQPTTAVAAATLVSNGGTALTDTDTFDGYTLKQIVKALRTAGLLA